MSKTSERYKIPEKITLVKSADDNWVYLVKGDSAESLDNAIFWANIKKGDTENIYTYPNGNFKLEIIKSAGKSSQGGKLSFWECDITTPDNIVFKLGINAESICSLIRSSVCTNGVIDKPVWLGYSAKGTYAYVEGMDEFETAKQIVQSKANLKASNSKYKAGDVVETIEKTEAYLGEAYKLFDYDYHYTTFNIYIKRFPEKYHVFADYSEDGKVHYIYFNKTKPKRIRTEIHIDDYKDILKERLSTKGWSINEFVNILERKMYTTDININYDYKIIMSEIESAATDYSTRLCNIYIV